MYTFGSCRLSIVENASSRAFVANSNNARYQAHNQVKIGYTKPIRASATQMFTIKIYQPSSIYKNTVKVAICPVNRFGSYLTP
jgi:hypothetical protein